MTTTNFTNEKENRRFLLGEMSELERETFEERFIEDEVLFDEIRVAEDELIESYIRGTLNLADKQKFETNYLISEKRIKKVAFTKNMLENLAAKNVSQENAVSEKLTILRTLIGFFTTPKLVFGTSFAILLLVFCGWFLIKSGIKENEMVQTVSPTPTIQSEIDKIEANQNSAIKIIENNSNIESVNSNKKSESNVTPTPKTTESPKVNKIAINPVLALFAGTVRSNGKIKEVALSENSNNIYLQLNLENRDYKFYRAEIVDEEGQEIFKTGKLSPRALRLSASVPTKKLKKGDFLVKVYGINDETQEESAADFQFRVNK